jgi:multisubunit Na+/H+ antiporter MnhC subunit
MVVRMLEVTYSRTDVDRRGHAEQDGRSIGMRGWRKVTWLLVIWTVVFALWTVGAAAAAGELPIPGGDPETDGRAFTAPIPFGFISTGWFVGFVVLAIVWFTTRPGSKVRHGAIDEPERAIAQPGDRPVSAMAPPVPAASPVQAGSPPVSPRAFVAARAADPRFARVEAEYRRLRGVVDAGKVTPTQLDAALTGLVFQADGRFWMIGANSGRWYASEGDRWIQADPPEE